MALLPCLIALLGPAGVHSPSGDVRPCARTVAIAPDGAVVAASYAARASSLLSSEDGRLLWELPGSPALRQDLAFSPDGRRLAGLDRAGVLRLWDVPSDAPPRLIAFEDTFDLVLSTCGGAASEQLLWSPRGDRLLAIHRTGQGRLWTREGESLEEWRGSPLSTAQTACWMPDGSAFCLADGESLRWRDGRTGETLGGREGRPDIECATPIVCVAISPKGDTLATGHPDCLVVTWDLIAGDELARAHHRDAIDPESHEEVASIAWSPAGDRVAISIRASVSVFVLDAEDLSETWTSGFLGAHFGEAMPVRWSPDGVVLWFAYECGNGLGWAWPPRRGLRGMVPSSGLPVFGGDAGVLLHDGCLRFLSPRGRRYW